MRRLWPFGKREKVDRGSTRMPRFGLAKLSGPRGYMGEAYVKELSRDGARLSHENPGEVPDALGIEIPSEGVRAEAVVKWRAKNLLGVKFSAPVELKHRPADPATRLRHLG